MSGVLCSSFFIEIKPDLAIGSGHYLARSLGFMPTSLAGAHFDLPSYPWPAPLSDQVFKNPFKDVLEEMTKPKVEKALWAVFESFALRCLEADGGNWGSWSRIIKDGQLENPSALVRWFLRRVRWWTQ